MITTGKIIEINLDSKNYKANKYKVEITLFKRPGDNNVKNYTFLANCSIMPGFNSCYEVGDVVYVAFLNNTLDSSIIIGKIYQGLDKKAHGYANLKSLSIQEKVDLPRNITIGDITYKDLENLISWKETFPDILYICSQNNYYVIDGGRISSKS